MHLKQMAQICAGYPFRGRITEHPDTGVWAVQMKDIGPDGRLQPHRCVQTVLTGKRRPDWLQSGDILFAARGSRNYAVLIDQTLEECGMACVAAPHFYIVRTKHPGVMPAYLAWLLNQAPCQRYFQREAEGSLTKSIRRSVLEHAPIAMPQLEKQQAIVQLDDTLHRERRTIEQLIRNGETTMNAIAYRLMHEDQPEHE